MTRPLVADDCLRCGACCVNSLENRTEAFRDYLEVTEKDGELLRRKDLLRKLATESPTGARHLRLIGEEQRCSALLGALGRSVRCAIYALRPACCRRVQPGDKECLARRREHGIDAAMHLGQGGPRR